MTDGQYFGFRLGHAMFSLMFADGAAAQYEDWYYEDYTYTTVSQVPGEYLAAGAMVALAIVLALEAYMLWRHGPRT